MPVVEGHPYEATIWRYCLSKLGNPVGAAAMLGNWRNESANYPNRLQGSHVGDGTSEAYTAKVDAGNVSKNDFVYNGPGGGGYGLAQWTYWSRKKNMWEFWKNGNYPSIGDLQLGLDFWWWELNNGYSGTLNQCTNGTDIREVTVYVLKKYERPADQGEEAQNRRTRHAQEYYDYYTGAGAGEGEDLPGTGGGIFIPSNTLTPVLPYLTIYKRRRYRVVR